MVLQPVANFGEEEDGLWPSFIFIFFKNVFYKNIFLISQFTVLYPYRPTGGRQGAGRPSLRGGRDLYVIKI